MKNYFLAGRRGERDELDDMEYTRGGGSSSYTNKYSDSGEHRRRGYSDKRGGQSRRNDRNRLENNPSITQTTSNSKIDDVHRRESRDVSSIDRGGCLSVDFGVCL
jgi:hypothetical protein